ncbi:hypothetical protein [Streptomyces californicus]|uniref:hypothetical protein n=1 Tax=Streptomyces californicus TaxID=67351 RepID=UPI00379EFB62
MKYSKRAADAAEGSATAAEQSVVETRRSSDAAERSATAAEETPADQRHEVAQRPRAEFRIEHRDKAIWELINYGTAAAENVRCSRRSGRMAARPLHRGGGRVSVHDGRVRTHSSVLRVVWEGQDEPVLLRVPPRIE